MDYQEQLALFVTDMQNKHVLSDKEVEEIHYVSDLFILAAQQNTPEPSLRYSAYRDDTAEEMYEILSMWIDWLHYQEKK